MDFVRACESAIGKKAKINSLDMQPGDVPATHADVSLLAQAFNYHPKTAIDEGVQRFVSWYKAYYPIE